MLCVWHHVGRSGWSGARCVGGQGRGTRDSIRVCGLGHYSVRLWTLSGGPDKPSSVDRSNGAMQALRPRSRRQLQNWTICLGTATSCQRQSTAPQSIRRRNCRSPGRTLVSAPCPDLMRGPAQLFCTFRDRDWLMGAAAPIWLIGACPQAGAPVRATDVESSRGRGAAARR